MMNYQKSYGKISENTRGKKGDGGILFNLEELHLYLLIYLLHQFKICTSKIQM